MDYKKKERDKGFWITEKEKKRSGNVFNELRKLFYAVRLFIYVDFKNFL